MNAFRKCRDHPLAIVNHSAHGFSNAINLGMVEHFNRSTRMHGIYTHVKKETWHGVWLFDGSPDFVKSRQYFKRLKGYARKSCPPRDKVSPCGFVSSPIVAVHVCSLEPGHDIYSI